MPANFTPEFVAQRNQLVTDHFRLTHWLVKHRFRCYLSDDLVQTAYLALVEAATTFLQRHPTRPTKEFGGYAAQAICYNLYNFIENIKRISPLNNWALRAMRRRAGKDLCGWSEQTVDQAESFGFYQE